MFWDSARSKPAALPPGHFGFFISRAINTVSTLDPFFPGDDNAIFGAEPSALQPRGTKIYFLRGEGIVLVGFIPTIW